MAVAFDKFTKGSTLFENNSFSWTHTPVGTPRGAVVIISQETGAADQVSGVTYGGVAMTRVRRDVRSAAEAGQVYVYFLGSGIPTGGQTVAVTTNPTSGADDWNAGSWTVTAAGDTAVDVDAGEQHAAAADPSLAITPTAQGVICYGLWSGLLDVVSAAQGGTTHRDSADYGADVGMWSDRTVASGGATTMGYTAASDVYVHSAVAVKEAVAVFTIEALQANLEQVGGRKFAPGLRGPGTDKMGHKR